MKSYTLFIFPFLLFIQVKHLLKFSKIKSNLESKEVKLSKSFEDLTDRDYWLARDQVISNFETYKEIKVGNYIVSEKEKQISELIRLFLTNKIIPDLTWKGKSFILIIWFLFFLLPASSFIFLYLRTDAKQEQIIKQCKIYNQNKISNKKEEDVYDEYCYCVSGSIINYIGEEFKEEYFEKLINIFLDPDLHPICNSELRVKLDKN